MNDITPPRIKVVAGYALQQKLGSGSFAVVYKGHKIKPTGQSDDYSAIKAITRNSEKLTKKVLQNLEIEIAILRNYKHRNIVCMHDVQKTENHFYMILEYCGGGDLQHLIRSRTQCRLSEGLTRRLMRDLADGLRFLWGQELIHRDIKPQNLLLTGLLPLDEVHDPGTDQAARQAANFDTAEFCLKIADFGFARHLQTASLAETLCGSPLYMAPEILQHHRYDAKADLWSVGTVLFEMITGDPPFHGENHIDLLRNIQRKAVRLPKDVKVSKECVTLLRLLLSRNPLSRAGFKEFFEACDKFVALGCNGVPTADAGVCKRPSMEPIPEHDGPDVVMNTSSPKVLDTPLPPVATVESSKNTAPRQRNPFLSPLFPNPPSSSGAMTELPTISSKKMPQPIEMPSRNDEATTTLQGSADDNSFVMVEIGSTQPQSQKALEPNTTAVVSHYVEPYRQDPRNMLEPSPPSSPAFPLQKTPSFQLKDISMPLRAPRGMLSTSPGTGIALMSLLTGRPKLANEPVPNTTDKAQLEAQIKSASKMLAASEDVGRRAICVAHLGDRQAFQAMRLATTTESNTSSMLSVTPMEGIEEHENEDQDSGEVTDDSSSTEIMASVRRRRSSSATDKSMAEARVDPEDVEMPFAVKSDSKPIMAAGLPSRAVVSFSKETSMTSGTAPQKPTPTLIRSHYNEALVCYLKALKMLKGAIGAGERVSKEVESLMSKRLSNDQSTYVGQIKKRNQMTVEWLGNQFRGVLERGDAANSSISKMSSVSQSAESQDAASIEELLYNHALSFGREGTVKQLLGHYEAARSCYRSAGLLAETVLMEPKIVGDDRKTLAIYVDGFAAQIKELDELILQQSQQSRLTASSATSSMASLRRGGPPVGLGNHPFVL